MRNLIPALVSSALVVVACSHKPMESKKTAKNHVITERQAASVTLKPKSGSQTGGTLMIQQMKTGVKITGEIVGLKPKSIHGFHIHENNDCSAKDASSAGGHFNPKDDNHGGPHSKERHLGDLGNITADDQGVVRVEMTNLKLQLYPLNNKLSVLGRSIIVHKNMDDLQSQPSGNAGKRIACGTIKF